MMHDLISREYYSNYSHGFIETISIPSYYEITLAFPTFRFLYTIAVAQLTGLRKG